MSRLSNAMWFGEQAHKGQVRKYTGKPYFTHCLAVAELVRKRGGDEDMIIAALLHDTVEDTDTTLWEIRSAFGKRVASLVEELTDVYTPEAYPHLNRAQRKEREAQRLGGISDDAKLIKICDLADNTSSIVEHDPKFAKVYLREKVAVLDAMLP